MKQIKEGNLFFRFNNQWKIFKFDEHPFYRNRMEKIDGTKAVDFLGIYGRKDLYLIEVKDFRRHRIENRGRILTGELTTEIAQKVKDSIAFIVGAYRMENNSELWDPCAKILLNKSGKVKVVLWMEADLPPKHPRLRQRFSASPITEVLKQKMNRLTSKILVCSQENQYLPDMEVRNVPIQE